MKAWNCVLIVGVGLIGGSVGLALRSRKLAQKIIGAGSRRSTLEAAHTLGAITEIATDLNSAAAEADFVVVCTPVGQIVEQVRQIALKCRPGTLITDAGSTKAQIVRELEQAAGADLAWQREVRFVGSHPLAGNEKRGPQNATSELFASRTVILTPTRRTRSEDCEVVSGFWTGLGACVRRMEAEEHDRALAATSHFPHLVASAIAASTPQQYVTLTAGGWRDTTRIAGGDPNLWRQIMLSNRSNMLASLDRFAAMLTEWRKALDANDAAELERLLTEAKRIRDAVGS